MRAATVSSQTLHAHRWRFLNTGAYLGNVQRAEQDLERATRYLKAAQTRFDNAKAKLAAEKELAARMEAEGKIIPLTPVTEPCTTPKS